MKPDRVRAIREEAGLTQLGLAQLLRMSDRRTVRRWEKNVIPVSGPASIILEMLAAGELPARFISVISEQPDDGQDPAD